LLWARRDDDESDGGGDGERREMCEATQPRGVFIGGQGKLALRGGAELRA
jgi:hypothetical protein